MLKFKWIEDDRNKKILYEKDFTKKKNKKNKLVINWERNLDWTGNPFIDTIMLPVSHFKGGRDKEIKEINKFIIQEKKFGIISGEPGSGKTFIMKWLEEELNTFQHKFNIFYFEALNSNHKNFIKKLSNHFSSFSLFNNNDDIFNVIKSHLSKTKKNVFLIDNAHNLSKESIDLIKEINSLQNTTIIISVNDHKKFKSFAEDELSLNLNTMDTDSLKEMIIKRIENFNGVNIEPFNSIQIKTLAKKASFNPRQMLKLCNEKAVEISLQKKDTIDPFDSIVEYEHEDEEIKESLPEGVLEGDMIIQEIVGEFNIEQLEEPKKKKKNK